MNSHIECYRLDNPFGSANAIPSYFYPSLGGYSGAKMSTFQDAFIDPKSIITGEYGINLGLLSALMNTRFITYNQLVIPGLTSVFQGSKWNGVENEKCTPKSIFCGFNDFS